MGVLRRLRYWRRWKADLRTESASDIPDIIPARHAVIVGTHAHQKWLVFDCPCGHGHRVMLNLDSSHYPRWRITNDYPITLIPSVDEHSHAGHCHYIVRDGRIRWVEKRNRA